MEFPIWEIVSLLLAGTGGFLGFKWIRVKKVFKEVAELLVALSDSIQDDRVSKEEVIDIVSEFQDVIDAIREK